MVGIGDGEGLETLSLSLYLFLSEKKRGNMTTSLSVLIAEVFYIASHVHDPRHLLLVINWFRILTDHVNSCWRICLQSFLIEIFIYKSWFAHK